MRLFSFVIVLDNLTIRSAGYGQKHWKYGLECVMVVTTTQFSVPIVLPGTSSAEVYESKLSDMNLRGDRTHYVKHKVSILHSDKTSVSRSSR